MKKSLILALLFSANAAAFKIDTHVWVGQQVIEDLQDGKLDFKVDGKTISVPVNNNTKDLILQNQSYYRSGNIGPDMSPDVIVGQSQIHTEDQLDRTMWNTSQWLDFLDSVAERDSERAFVLGFKAHAAADIFAHTYVNRYAGGAFDLADGEIDVELRHILIESLISKHTPKGAYSSQLSVPVGFIRDKIVYNPDTQSQWNSPSGSHLYAINTLRKNVEDLAYSNIFKELKVAAVKAVAKAQAGIQLNDQTAEKIVELGEDINKVSNWNIDKAQQVRDAATRFKKDLTNGHQKLISAQLDTINNAANAVVKAHGELSNARLKLAKLTNELNSIPMNLTEKVTEKVCKNVKSWSGGLFGGWVTKKVCESKLVEKIIGLNPTYKVQQELIRAEKRLVEKLGSSINKEVSKLKKASKEAHEILKSTIDLENQLAQNLIDTLQQFNSASISPVEAFLKAWLQNIDLATTQYIHNINHAVIYSVTDKDRSQKMINDWVTCYSSGLMGMPVTLTSSRCTVEDYLQETLDKLSEIMHVVSPAYKVYEEIQRIKSKVANKAVEKLIKELTSDELYQLLKHLRSDMSEVALQRQFSKDNSGKGLLVTNDIVTRIKADMHVTGNSQFNPSKFAAAHNAVVLAKLSILNYRELNHLIAQFGLSSSQHYGSSFYYAGENILSSAVRSLDGNHQWQEVAPQYVRRTGFSGVSTQQRKFGYAHNNGTQGFKLWQDPNAQSRIFKQLFIGPLVPGIDAPSEVGLSPLSGIQYTLDSCSFAPFPQDEQDRTCTVIKVLPALTMLN
ncbi:zinc dependent phospholipase C family protein [Pseudoalteromonas sp. McH1-42]|uniref:zinc dependent phospholipase C family protein n=1 Tax=Pseudoalteromonas sp. McH1-42 TaxID=2917752 RepID=UPI001EF4EA47|nr:zinc dependent phospholipase C family protein [Pseudoalteromonas sp. McH1-42]MCG7561414.1 zinc dependent phospholipase C family protein [Pseudoalteromonas sp. McH1-42]